MRARVIALALFVAGGPAGVSAQDHGPAPAKQEAVPKPAAAADKAALPAKDAHAAPKDAKAAPQEAHAAPKDPHAAPKDAHAADAAGAHGGDHAASPAKPKPKPKVSTVAAPATHAAPDDHAPAPAAESHGATGQTRTGYVATGARKAAAGGGKGKPKPVVSAGAVPDVVPKPAAAEHGSEPAKLSDVHERITEVLAGFHAEAHVSAAGDRGAHGAEGPDKPSPGGRRRADGARVAVRWPGPRRTLAWPGPPRLTLAWPDVPASAAPARPADPH